MTPTVGVCLATIPGATLGVAGSVLLAVAAARAARPARDAFGLLAGGLLVVAGALGAVTALVARDDRTTAVVVVAAGLSVGSVAMLTGLLRLPTVATDLGAVLRHGVEGLLVTACAVYVAWVLAVDPWTPQYLGRAAGPELKIVALLLLTPALVATGVSIRVAAAVRGGPAVGGLLAGPATVAGGLVLLAGLGTSVALAITGGLALAAALAVVPPLGRRATRLPGAASAPRRGHPAWLGPLPVGIAIAACVVHLAIWRGADNPSILIAAVIGLALSVRQTFVMREVRAYADAAARREERFRQLAHTDSLTGLDNRRSFQLALEKQTAGGGPATLLSIDLDGFKAINDAFGHEAGDTLLVEVGKRLRGNLRSGDVAARIGGDEFAVLLALGPSEAVAAAARLRAVLAAPYDYRGAPVAMSASIGLVPYGPGDIADLMRHADSALRFAKTQGKNRIEGWDTAYVEWLRRRTTIEEELRGALTRGELTLVYQPVVTLPEGRTVGAEALLRWHHPALGPVPPAEFVPVADDTGLVTDLGRWVLREACRQVSRWLADGHDVWVSVNVSARELWLTDYRAAVAEALSLHHVPPERLVVEVSEHAVAVDDQELPARLAAVRELGVRVALDRVGAGFSTLGRLRGLPVDVLKITRSIVAEADGAVEAAPVAPTPPHAQRRYGDRPRALDRRRPASTRLAEGRARPGPFVDALVRIGDRLGVDVIAVGVADDAARRLVTEAGCRLAQGDAFGAPVPAEHIEARLAAEAPTDTPAPWPMPELDES